MSDNNHLDGAPSAHFADDHHAVVITDLTVSDQDVVREACRWTTGERGPIVDEPAELDAADLGEFVTKAVTIGAHALSATGQSAEAQAIERMIADLGEKASQSTSNAAEVTSKAVTSATEAVTKAAGDAQKAFLDADAATRRSLTQSVTAARIGMEAELKRLFGGTNPEVVDRFAPLLQKFAADLEKQASTSTGELLAKAAKQFDPSDPSSPMARHAAHLTASQKQLSERIDKQHKEITDKLTEVTTALRVNEAKDAVSKVTPIKGDTYEAEVHTVIQMIAAGLGDEYTETGTTVGAVPRSKKGDGVLTAEDGVARVVIEMTDSKRDSWVAYLDEAERNRVAQAALGLVRTAEQNNGETLRVVGKRRIVLAFDPSTDDSDILRTVLQLLRTSAIAAASRAGTHEIATAEEKIAAALVELEKVDDVKRLAGMIQKNAQKVENNCSGIASGIQRLLGDALNALGAASHSTDDGASTHDAA